MVNGKPLAIDLYCGLGGWADGFLAEGYDVIGFDVKKHDYGTGGYPGQLVLQDVLTLSGAQFKGASVIVASPPCQAYSYRAMPWKRAKALPPPSNELFDACFRIQREACEAAGRHIPLIVENVRGAQKWVGRAQANYGSYFLWGDIWMVGNRIGCGKHPRDLRDVKLLVSPYKRMKSNPDGTGHSPGSWFKIADSKERGSKNNGGSWFAIGSPGQKVTGQNPDGRKINGPRQERELAVGEFGWHKTMMADGTSKSAKRKAASAMIAKIPFPLAQHIARVFKPTNASAQASAAKAALRH